VVLTNREHIIALEPLKNGSMGTLPRYPYEVRSEDEYFDEIQDVEVIKDMLDLAKHIVNQKASTFELEKFEEHYEAEPVELINQKAKRQDDCSGATTARRKRGRPNGCVEVQHRRHEMLLPIGEKKPGKEAAKKAAKPQRRSA
jgi:DNA end-binding protein Ku